MQAVLQFWFEFASTYSYVAASRIEQVASQAGVAIEWKPFLLGPVFREQGWDDSPFNIYPTKGRYMWRDMERLCEKEHIPLRRPTEFPRNGLLAARVARVGARAGWCPRFSRGVYHANFAEDRDIGREETVLAILDALQLDGREVMASAQAPENKEGLRADTEEAMRLGIFGAPTFVVGQEVFWGNDRLEDAVAWCLRAQAH
jgi:2-hydroxychromene-2-carboxylate isomerase